MGLIATGQKSQEDYSKEGYGSKRAVLQMMMSYLYSFACECVTYASILIHIYLLI
jgi:hypothetical protein